METLSLRKNYHPLCDRHRVEMMPMSNMPSQSESTQHCCTEECTRQYEALAGYYDWVDGGEISSPADSSRTCGQDKLGMYLATYNKETKREEWRCPACQHIEVVYL
jgi:hypothetical protein